MEKIHPQKTGLNNLKKHLHIRGENMLRIISQSNKAETPPHTWRKFCSVGGKMGYLGNTSTYVEKIVSSLRAPMWTKKHLHIRGENSPTKHGLATRSETPPHTWRKCNQHRKKLQKFRNTSTYVEKIQNIASNIGNRRNTSTYVEKITFCRSASPR